MELEMKNYQTRRCYLLILRLNLLLATSFLHTIKT